MTSVYSLLAIGGLWALFFWGWKAYRLDAYRNDLFAVRDRLFMLAATGKIPFDAPAYGMLRDTINGFIRFGHEMTLPQFVAVYIFVLRSKHADSIAENYSQRWNNACSSLPASTRQELQQLRNDMHQATSKQLLLSSIVGLLATGIVLASLAIGACRRRLPSFKDIAGSGPFGSQVTSRLDSAVFNGRAYS